MNTPQAEQGRISVTVNRLQSQVLADKKQTFSDSSKTSNGADFRHGPPPPGAQKLGFPKYDGTEDPLGWLHKCELFFHSGRSVHVFSILPIALTRVSSCSMKLVALPSHPQAALLQPACPPAAAVPNPLSSFVSSSLLCSWVVRCERSAVRPRQWPRVAALRGVLVLASVRQPSSLPPLQQGKVQSGNVQPTRSSRPALPLPPAIPRFLVALGHR